MAHKTFSWKPLVEPTGEDSARILTAQFGDGYKQVVGDGINNITQSWQLQFAGAQWDVQPVIEFIREHQGFKPFKWTPPLGEEGLYEATGLRINPKGNKTYSLSVTFTQRFEP